ncbi:hypothetical protein PX699_13425 [Sphingobium sp. H39-3-25]|uniref:hypothetical protein n=1 Tax=Sphingobium arseniciresistens TaxID=3030834 RepID=UPI0023B892D4|nr:hypothetical protein [Sphingobium arseniciresistens]
MTTHCADFHIELLSSMFQVHRAIKADPKHADKIELQNQHVRMIGQAIAQEGGGQAMRQFIDRFYEATKSDDAETWLYRRWDGIRLPDGSVWVS